MKIFRLVRSDQSSALYNMALDKNMLIHYLEDGIPVLRVYRWRSPSFTYGFSQNPESSINLSACAREKVDIAKRITGGGILFHQDEITYSFVCSKQDVGEPEDVFVSYRKICSFLMSFYGSLGLNPFFALESRDFKKRSSPHEFCSAAYEKYDIVINGRKIGGNAQKRIRQVIFQHGSIPCSIDWSFVHRYINSLPEDISSTVTTLSEEMKVVPDKDALEQALIDAFGSVFGVRFIEEKEVFYETSMA